MARQVGPVPEMPWPGQRLDRLHGSPRSAGGDCEYRRILRDHPEAAALRIEQLDETWRRSFAREGRRSASSLKRLRRSVETAAGLFVAWCRYAGVSPQAVAYAVLPTRAAPWEGDRLDALPVSEVGSWRVRGVPGDHSSWCGMNGVELRADGEGGSGAHVQFMDGRIEMLCWFGGITFWSWRETASLLFAGLWPNALAAGAIGRRMRDVVSHPMLDDLDCFVLDVILDEIFGDTEIRFSCPTTPWTVTRPSHWTFPLHLASGARGAGATEELLDRTVRRYGLKGMDATALVRIASERAREINAGGTAAGRIPKPSLEQGRAALERAGVRDGVRKACTSRPSS